MRISAAAIVILVLSASILFAYVWLGGVMGDRVIVDPIPKVPEKIETAKLDLPEKTATGTEERKVPTTREEMYYAFPEYDINLGEELNETLEEGYYDEETGEYIPSSPAYLDQEEEGIEDVTLRPDSGKRICYERYRGPEVCMMKDYTVPGLPPPENCIEYNLGGNLIVSCENTIRGMDGSYQTVTPPVEMYDPAKHGEFNEIEARDHCYPSHDNCIYYLKRRFVLIPAVDPDPKLKSAEYPAGCSDIDQSVHRWSVYRGIFERSLSKEERIQARDEMLSDKFGHIIFQLRTSTGEYFLINASQMQYDMVKADDRVYDVWPDIYLVDLSTYPLDTKNGVFYLSYGKSIIKMLSNNASYESIWSHMPLGGFYRRLNSSYMEMYPAVIASVGDVSDPDPDWIKAACSNVVIVLLNEDIGKYEELLEFACRNDYPMIFHEKHVGATMSNDRGWRAYFYVPDGKQFEAMEEFQSEPEVISAVCNYRPLDSSVRFVTRLE